MANSRSESPCWLTLCGRSENGKTFCADQIWQRAVKMGIASAPAAEFEPQKIWWPGYVNKLRGGSWYDHLEDTRKWPLLYVDEIGANRDTTGYVADQLYVLLGQREKKWTMLTTNLTLNQLAAIDERIASRCVRNGGIVVEVNTMPYSKR